MNSFEQTQLVEAQHLDELQHVNNVQYLQWVQDIAGAHWQNSLKEKKKALGFGWCVPIISNINAKPSWATACGW